MFTSLKAKKFTAFDNVELEFVPGINIFIGANATGKTHLLKVLYSLQYASQDKKDLPSYETKLVNVFRPLDDQINRMVRRTVGRSKASVTVHWGDEKLELTFSNMGTPLKATGQWHKVTSPVYLPVKEMLSMAPGFRSIYSKYDTRFEEIYYDIIDLAYVPALRGAPGADRQQLSDTIKGIVNGRVVTEGEQFFLKSEDGNLEITLVSEGLRKLALIALLIQNGSLQSGSTLFWDEPEANLNPSMMRHVAKILLTLAKLEVQVFVATHNYAFLKEIALQRQDPTAIRYFSLFMSEDQEGVQVRHAENYAAIEPNLIADEYTRIYELELDKSLGGAK